MITPKTAAGHKTVIALLSVVAAILFAMQYTTMYKLAVLPASLSYQSLGRFLQELSYRQIRFDSLDLFLGIALGLSIALLLVLEWRRAQLTHFLSYALSTKLRAVLFFSLCTLVLIRYYFAPGQLNWAGDASQHIIYADITRDILRAGEWPIWTNALGAGSPFAQFYGFLFFYLTALISLCTAALFPALKIALAGCHILSGLGVFALTSQLTHSRTSGFFAGLVYVLCVWHFQHVLVMGRLPLGLFYGLLPWPFYFFERARRGTMWPNALSASLLLGLLAFTHPGYAFWATVLFAVYAMGHLLHVRQRFIQQLGTTSIILFVGLLAGSYLTLGMWLEKGYTGLNSGYLLSGIPAPTWWHVLVWSNYRFWLIAPTEPFHWYGGYLGLSALALALFGLVYCLIRLKTQWLPLWLPFLLSVLLVVAHDLPPFNLFAVIQAFPPVRYLLFITFFLSIAAGIGFRFIEVLARRAHRTQVPISVFIVLLIDLGPTTFQYPYHVDDLHGNPTGYGTDIFFGLRERGAKHIDEGFIPNYRFLWSSGTTHPYLAASWPYFFTHVPTPGAIHPGDLLSGSTFTGPAERLLNHIFTVLDDPSSLNTDSYHLALSLLRLINVHNLLSTLSDNSLQVTEWPQGPVISSASLLPVETAGVNSPFVTEKRDDIIHRLLLKADPTNLLNFLPVLETVQKMNLRDDGLSSEHILIRGIDTPIKLPTQATFKLSKHTVTHTKVDIHLSTSDSTFVRLAYSYFPYLSVRVNGQRVQPYETAGHFMALPLGKGRHHIEIAAELSPLRKVLLAAHILVWIATALLWFRHWRST